MSWLTNTKTVKTMSCEINPTSIPNDRRALRAKRLRIALADADDLTHKKRRSLEKEYNNLILSLEYDRAVIDEILGEE